MKIELKKTASNWSIFVDGYRVMDRESFAVADRIRQELQNPSGRMTEASEVADSIKSWVERKDFLARIVHVSGQTGG